ncbi:MAG: hypothetical protein D6780_07490, partial [Candidatus Dadabacteria bacterium]
HKKHRKKRKPTDSHNISGIGGNGNNDNFEGTGRNDNNNTDSNNDEQDNSEGKPTVNVSEITAYDIEQNSTQTDDFSVAAFKQEILSSIDSEGPFSRLKEYYSEISDDHLKNKVLVTRYTILDGEAQQAIRMARIRYKKGKGHLPKIQRALSTVGCIGLNPWLTKRHCGSVEQMEQDFLNDSSISKLLVVLGVDLLPNSHTIGLMHRFACLVTKEEGEIRVYNMARRDYTDEEWSQLSDIEKKKIINDGFFDGWSGVEYCPDNVLLSDLLAGDAPKKNHYLGYINVEAILKTNKVEDPLSILMRGVYEAHGINSYCDGPFSESGIGESCYDLELNPIYDLLFGGILPIFRPPTSNSDCAMRTFTKILTKARGGAPVLSPCVFAP